MSPILGRSPNRHKKKLLTRMGVARLERVLCTGGAGRAGTRIRSEALHRMLTIGRLAADRAGARPGARPYHSPNVYFGQQLAFVARGRILLKPLSR
jgi:hypothetical protein